MPEGHDSTVALVVLAQADYTSGQWEALPELPKAAHELAHDLAACGYRLELPQLLDGGSRQDVMSPLEAWLRSLEKDDRLVLYWTGHGDDVDPHWLVLRDSPRPAGSADAVNPADLGYAIAASKVEKILVILDACYSSASAAIAADAIMKSLNARTQLPGQIRWWGVLPSAHALEKAQAAVFCKAVHKVLTEPQVKGRLWGDDTELISVDELMLALLGELDPNAQPPNAVHGGAGDRFLPNPRYCLRGPAMDVETRRRLLVPDALEVAARGVEVGEPGEYFTGRNAVLSELEAQLKPGRGVIAVTGSPGAGKSAVLGRIATQVAGGAIPSTLDAVAHAKGATTHELATRIGQQIGLEVAREATFDPEQFARQIADVAPPVVLIDALDESREPQSIGTMIRMIAEEAGATIVVGTRLSPDGRPLPDDEERHSRLHALLGEHAQVVDLDLDADTTADLTGYVSKRLLEDPRSRHHNAVAAVADVADAVAKQAAGSFLYGRIISRTLQEAPTLENLSLPAGPLAAFTTDLDARFSAHRQLVDQLLAALAWGEGGGLSRAVWPRVATALASVRYVDGDVEWLLENVGAHVLEAGSAGQTVYRLAHQAFADHYRRSVHDAARAQRAITNALVTEPYRR